MTPPGDWVAMAMLAFALGVKHGLDPDHLAAIDGLTRFNLGTHARLARLCGALFSIGHGIVVVAIAAVVGTFALRWTVPVWLEDVGACLSIGFLLLLGLLNLLALVRSSAGAFVAPVGLRARLLGGCLSASTPSAVVLIGALFAISFDTVSQAALFAVAGSALSGVQAAVSLGALFLLGMLVTDAVNGFWIAALLARADDRAQFASRVMAILVGTLSIGVAVLGIARYFSPRLGTWLGHAGATVTLAIFGLLLVGFVASMAMASCFDHRRIDLSRVVGSARPPRHTTRRASAGAWTQRGQSRWQ